MKTSQTLCVYVHLVSVWLLPVGMGTHGDGESMSMVSYSVGGMGEEAFS